MLFARVLGFQLLITLSFYSYSQSWEHFSTKNNLSDNHVTSVAIDKYNHKWITTGGGGLVKYDGRSWTVFNTATTHDELRTDFLTCIAISGDAKWIGTKTGLYKLEDEVWTEYSSMNTNRGLPVSQVNAITIDKKGVLWVATNNGLSSLNDTTWTYYSKYTIPELAGNKVLCVAEDAEGNKWVGTSSGLSMFNGESWKNISKGNAAFKDQNILNIVIDKINNIWIATGGGGLVRFNGKDWKSYTAGSVGVQGFADNLRAFFCDPDNTLWFACQKGLLKFSNERFDLIKSEEGDIDLQELPACITMDLEKGIWIGTEKTGLWSYDEKGWRNYNAHNNLPNDFIYSVAADHEDKMWIGTNGGGVVKFSNAEWILYNQSNGLADPYIKTLVIERKHNIYAGSQWGGLFKFDGHVWQSFNTSNSRIPSDHISALEFDNNDLLWLGTEGNGVLAFDGELWTSFTAARTSGMIPDDHITSLKFETKTKTLWVGTQAGLTVYSNSIWKNNEQFAARYITCIGIDSSGNKWIGTREGIYRLNEKLEFFGPEDISEEVSEISVNTIYTDKNNIVWIGTDQGLIKYQNGNWSVYNRHTTYGDLSSDNIYSVVADKKGFIWVGTSNGLFKADFSSASSALRDRDSDGVVDSLDLCPEEAGIMDNRGCPSLEGVQESTLKDAFTHLLFESSKDVILHSSFKSLNELAKVLMEDGQLKLYVEGHTDNLGDERTNKDLSRRRAEAVKAYLVSKGVEEERISAKGFGSSKPKTSNDSEEGRKANRRVEMFLYHGR